MPMSGDEGRERNVTRDAAGIRILFVDPRALTRQSLPHFLRSVDPACQVIPVAEPDAALEIAELPHLVIFNIGMAPLMSAYNQHSVETLAARFEGIPLIIISGSDEPEAAMWAVKLGARAYIPTSMDSSVAAAAIRLALAGGTFVPVTSFVPSDGPTAEQNGGHQAPGRTPADESPELTQRELQVMEMIRTGKPNKVIAHELNMRESTVKSHLRQIKRKLRAHNRVELALIAKDLL